MVVDPFGVVLLDIRQQEGMETVDIDKARIQQVRRSLPLLKNRRSDIYRLSHK
jgi:predicted amidohydrolase